jgi:DNA recombination protein RmuC
MPISPLTIAISLIVGLIIGAVVGWLATRPARSRLEFQLERDRAVHAERLKAYEDAESRLRDSFQVLTSEALNSNNQAFLHLAETRLGQSRTEATADIDARKKAIEELLAPMAKTLDQVDREIKESERRRTASSEVLIEKLRTLDVAGQDLRSQTARLVDALKRPGVRGRWGELQLKRVVELAGMLDRCDFEEQHTITAAGNPANNGESDRRLRPDVIVTLPGGKHVVIDAKVPLDAYLKALEAPDEAARQVLLADHARQVRVHLMQLSSKGYASHVQPSPDFVVMFLPGEMFFSAALEQDPSLIEFGIGLEQRVIPASPTTLIALLRAVAYGWQQQAMEENARKISELGRNLYESVRVLGGHFEDLGTKLKGSLDAYNKAVGSLEGNVLVKARKFKEYQAANGGEEIKALEPIDRVPRMLQAPDLTDGLPFQAEEAELIEAVEEETRGVFAGSRLR